MKRFLFVTSVIALGLIMGSCNDLKKMAANADDINYSVNPKVLEVHNGQVAVNITGISQKSTSERKYLLH